MLKKLMYFVLLFAYFLCVVGGFGYAIFCHEWVFAVAIVIVGYMAFFKAKEWFKIMMDI